MKADEPERPVGDKPAEGDFYYTVSEAAQVLRISETTVTRWIAAGTLPAYRVGPKHIRIKPVDLKSAIERVVPRKGKAMSNRKNIWAGYNPNKIIEMLDSLENTWADVDAESLIASIYRARGEGTRRED